MKKISTAVLLNLILSAFAATSVFSQSVRVRDLGAPIVKKISIDFNAQRCSKHLKYLKISKPTLTCSYGGGIKGTGLDPMTVIQQKIPAPRYAMSNVLCTARFSAVGYSGVNVWVELNKGIEVKEPKDTLLNCYAQLSEKFLNGPQAGVLPTYVLTLP